jgi:Holliday junction resolvase RusA-like endonuclease
VRRKTHVATYTPQATADWEHEVAWQARAQTMRMQMDGRLNAGALPLRHRVAATLSFRLRRPVSAPKRVTHPLRKPDVDNLAKAVLDALVEAGVLGDDALITDLNISKRFATPPTEPEGVTVWLLGWSA